MKLNILYLYPDLMNLYGEIGNIKAINDMVTNLIRNSRTEIIDGKIQLIVTEDRIKTIAKQLKEN